MLHARKKCGKDSVLQEHYFFLILLHGTQKKGKQLLTEKKRKNFIFVVNFVVVFVSIFVVVFIVVFFM